MNPITFVFDHLGFYGPLIAMVMAFVFLWNQPKFLIVYAIFVFVNQFINKGLKLLFREPRPENPIHFSEYEKYSNEEKYGMPSGHAQSIVFTIVFLWLVKRSPDIFMVTGFIGAITLYQRFKYRRHTISQLIIGSIAGFVVAVAVYWASICSFKP